MKLNNGKTAKKLYWGPFTWHHQITPWGLMQGWQCKSSQHQPYKKQRGRQMRSVVQTFPHHFPSHISSLWTQKFWFLKFSLSFFCLLNLWHILCEGFWITFALVWCSQLNEILESFYTLYNTATLEQMNTHVNVFLYLNKMYGHSFSHLQMKEQKIWMRIR